MRVVLEHSPRQIPRDRFDDVVRFAGFKQSRAYAIDCLEGRSEGVYKWECDKGDESLAIAVNGSLLLDELDLVIQAALDGAELAWVAEDRITGHLASGSLVRSLED